MAGNTEAGRACHTLALRIRNLEEKRFIRLRWTSATYGCHFSMRLAFLGDLYLKEKVVMSPVMYIANMYINKVFDLCRLISGQIANGARTRRRRNVV